MLFKPIESNSSNITRAFSLSDHFQLTDEIGKLKSSGYGDLQGLEKAASCMNTRMMPTTKCQDLNGGTCTMENKMSSLMTLEETSVHSANSSECLTDIHSWSNSKEELASFWPEEFSSPIRCIQDNSGMEEQKKIYNNCFAELSSFSNSPTNQFHVKKPWNPLKKQLMAQQKYISKLEKDISYLRDHNLHLKNTLADSQHQLDKTFQKQRLFAHQLQLAKAEIIKMRTRRAND